MRKPSLLGFDVSAIPGNMDYYEMTMADTSFVAGISGRKSVFNAAFRGLGLHKVVSESDFTSDGYTCVIGGKERRFAEFQEDLKGKNFHLDIVEPDNYQLSMGLEQILAFLTNWEMNDTLINAFSRRGLNLKTIDFLRGNRKLDLTVEAIPDGIPIFGHEPYLSVEGAFEQAQFPESLILGTWGYQTAVATQASYVLNILEEFGRSDIKTLEGGSRRLYPAVALAAARAVLAAGFSGTSLVGICQYYPELLYRFGGSSAHSAVLHIGSDEKAFELQLRAYYHIEVDDSDAIIREKIMKSTGVGVTFLIDTFDSNDGLNAAIRVMKKYGIQTQVRTDSGNPLERVTYIRATLDNEELPKGKIMPSGDLKPWTVYELLKSGADFNLLLMGTYLVNPYRLPGPVYKLGADQDATVPSIMNPVCKVCKDSRNKGTLPGQLDIYRIIGRDGKADRDVILLRGAEKIDAFMERSDQDKILLNRRVIEHGQLIYDVPDMCTLIESRAYHMGLLRPEHKRFIGAEPYNVIISPAVKQARDVFEKKALAGHSN